MNKQANRVAVKKIGHPRFGTVARRSFQPQRGDAIPAQGGAIASPVSVCATLGNDPAWTKSPNGAALDSGSVLVAVLVCLSVVMAILGTMLQGTLRARRQLHVERDLRQTELLLQAGADRAAMRLSSETDYRGETWNLPADSIIGHRDGQVTIDASRDSDEEPWLVRVVAEYGPGSPWSIRRSRTFRFAPHSSQKEE